MSETRVKSSLSAWYILTRQDFSKYCNRRSASGFLTIKDGVIMYKRRSKSFFLLSIIRCAGRVLFLNILGDCRRYLSPILEYSLSTSSIIGMDTACKSILTSMVLFLGDFLNLDLHIFRAYKQPSPSIRPASHPFSSSDKVSMLVNIPGVAVFVKRNLGHPNVKARATSSQALRKLKEGSTTNVYSLKPEGHGDETTRAQGTLYSVMI